MSQPLYYLSCPYEGKDEEENNRAAICRDVATRFLQQKVHVFAPLPYTEVLMASLPKISPEERRVLFMPYLLSFLERCDGLILLTLNGWKSSKGIAEEIKLCKTGNIPVYTLNEEELNSSLEDVLEMPVSLDLLEKLRAS
jgi:hypothetical protein